MAVAGGGGYMAALILNLDNIWKRLESHLVALCLTQRPTEREAWWSSNLEWTLDRKNKSVAPLSGSNPKFLGCPTHSLLTQQTLSYCFISHSSNHFYLNRNQQQAFFFRSSPKQITRELKHLTVLTKSRIKMLRELKNLIKLSRSRIKISRE